MSANSSEDDLPLSARLLKRPAVAKQITNSINNQPIDNGNSSDSDIPLSKKILKKNAQNGIKKEKPNPVPKPKVKNEATSPKIKREPTTQKIKVEADTPKRKPINGVESGNNKRAKDVKPIKGEVKDEDEDEDEEYQWWLQEGDGDKSVKWNTLEHNGVYFPPPYEPHNVKMLYDGKPITLPPEAEEVASFFAALIESDYARNPVFVRNFFKDFKDVLKECKADTDIKEFKKCDFTPIFNYLQALKEQKKSKTKEEKLQDKKDKEVIDEHYGYAILNGRKEKLGNFRIEPPGLFRGRGDHPKTGCLKRRVSPEQITINIGKEAKVPTPPPGHKWGKVIHDNTVAWLATWKENINGLFKYVLFGATSSLKGQSDMKKFEKARELKGCIDDIRSTYMEELKDKVASTRQRATALYLIDRLALRAGNEKGEDEADTVGCCSLRYEHVTLVPPNTLKFDFLGKDSIRYQNEVQVIEQVYKNIAIFKKSPKKEGDMIFDRLNTGTLNRHLASLLPGLSAKVFRTYNASFTFQNQLKSTPEDGTIHEKLLAYNRANRQVAILCNHQRSVSKGFETQMERIDDKLKTMQFQRHRLKLEILSLDPKAGKRYPELLVKDENHDEFWCTEHVDLLMEKEREKARLKFEKTNVVLKEKGEKVQGESVLKEKLDELDAEHKILLKEVKNNKVSDSKKVNTVEKLMDKLDKLNARISAANTSKIDKDENKTTALGTSKINYIDPRISVAWCAKYKVPLDKIFNRTLRDKFKWATIVDENYVRFVFCFLFLLSKTNYDLGILKIKLFLCLGVKKIHIEY
ncbi:hypothetical protein K502DRAFT_304983 [Neoconidiobolus thromboides FSU 785]|nr:hypothetical protein K502DRAFT_304983 [Neoconidiobolus thromboides FSU 785]